MSEMEEDVPDQDQNPEDSDDSSDSSSDDNDNDEELQEKVRQLRDTLCTDPFNYDLHIELINTLRQLGDLDEVRAARETFAAKFPLTTALWTEWINDEKAIVQTTDDREHVISLFERATKDYVTPEIWLEYISYMMSLVGHDEGNQRIRDVCERALTSVGVHTLKGSLIWDTYRDLEKILLETLPEDQRDAQSKRIFDLYKRQLSVPLLDMHKTYQEFMEWTQSTFIAEQDIKNVKIQYDKASAELAKVAEFENLLINSEPPHREEYLKYLDYCEQNNLSAIRMSSVFERAITDNCLDIEIWTRYIKYLEKHVNVSDVQLPVIARAVRNCPWSSFLWIKYLEFLESAQEPEENITKIFEQALVAGLPSANDFYELWLAYLSYRRRITDFADEQKVKHLMSTFDAATNHLATMEGSDPEAGILTFKASVQTIHMKNVEEARNTWNQIMENREYSQKSSLWLAFYQFEDKFGTAQDTLKLLSRALQPYVDWPEVIGNLWIKREREIGTLETYQTAFKKYEKLMKTVNEKRAKLAEKNAPAQEQQQQATTASSSKGGGAAKKNTVQQRKRKVDDSKKDVFKAPAPVPQKKSKKETEEKPKDNATADPPKFLKPNRSDVVNKLQTVFVSNLDFNTEEQTLRDEFSKFGTITDLRLVCNYKGVSKGYCYIEYSTIEGAKEALKHDRLLINGRPAFVNEIDKKKQFEFSTDVEPNKLFIRNLSHDTTNETLEQIFAKYGQLKDIRVVTYRNGHSKGCAYVEFKDDLSAKSALQANGTLVKGKNIEVAISDPKAAAMKRGVGREAPQPNQILGGGRMAEGGTRKRIAAPFIPNVLRRKPAPSNGH